MTRARNDDSTSNLIRHVNKCAGILNMKPGQIGIKDFAHGSTYNPAKLRYKLAIWVTRRHRPFSIVEDPELVDIFHDFHAGVIVPSRQTLVRDIKDILDLTKSHLADILKSVQGKIHLVIDGWTSPQTYSFIGVMVVFVQGPKLRVIVLDYIRYATPNYA